MSKIKPIAFWPPFVLCAAAVALSFAAPDLFLAAMKPTIQWVSDSFGWLVMLLAFAMLVLCAAIFVSPFGRTVIGGPGARPLLTRWQMFAVVLTTNIAIGVLFWGAFEPLAYLSKPAASAHAAPNSPEAALFAISTVYLHWTCTPYAIATLVGLMFAFAYYNMKKPFSLGAPLSPLLGRHDSGKSAHAIDALCLYSLVVAMAAALAGASLLLGGGIHHVFGIQGEPSNLLLAVIMAAVMGAAVAAAVSGLTRGIRLVANINTAFLVLFLAMIFLLGPTRFILNFATEGLGYFLSHYFEKALYTGAARQDGWPLDWTQMQFSAWFAWAPIMGVFLGRIAYGYTVRTYLLFNVLLPALFTGTWMAVFCGATVHAQLYEGVNLVGLLDPGDPSRVLFAFLERLPLAGLLVPILLITSFLSFVTTADATTDAMGNISSVGISPENPESSMPIKIAWGLVVGLLSWIMLTFGRLDGIRMLSKLGGLPALLLCLGVSICAIRVMLNPARFDTFKAGYDSAGRPLGRERREDSTLSDGKGRKDSEPEKKGNLS